MAGNFTYAYVFQKNIAYAVSEANFLTYLTAKLNAVEPQGEFVNVGLEQFWTHWVPLFCSSQNVKVL